MIFTIIQFIVWWFALDTSESYFSDFIRTTMPNFRERLQLKDQLRQYQSNAPALVNSLVCTLISFVQISSQTWNVPMPLVAYCLYDSIRGCTKIMRIHHGISLALLCVSNLNEHTRYAAPYFLLTELSTVPLCLMGIIRGTKRCPRTLSVRWEKTYLQALKEIFFVSFLGVRVILPLSPAMHLYNKYPLALVFVAPLVGLNYYWFTKMVTNCLFQ